jgi:transposase
LLSRAMAKVWRNSSRAWGRWAQSGILVEATGGSETVVAAAPAGASLPVVVVNPAQVRPFAKVPGRRAGERQFEEIHHWRSNEPEAFAGPL